MTKMSREQLEEHGLRQVECLGFPEVSWADRGASPLSFAVDLEEESVGSGRTELTGCSANYSGLAGVHGGLTGRIELAGCTEGSFSGQDCTLHGVLAGCSAVA